MIETTQSSSDKSVVVNDRLTNQHHEADVPQQILALENKRKETIAAISFTDLVRTTPIFETLCSSLETLGLLDQAIIEIRGALDTYLAEKSISISDISYNSDGQQFCKFLLYAGDKKILEDVWNRRNEMDVYRLLNILESAVMGPLAQAVMEKMAEPGESPALLVRLISQFKEGSIDPKLGWAFAQKCINLEDLDSKHEVLTLLHRNLDDFVTEETAAEILAYVKTTNINRVSKEKVLEACARCGLQQEVWDFLRANWNFWRESYVVTSCISSKTAKMVLEAYNPALFGETLPRNIDTVFEECVLSNPSETIDIVLAYIQDKAVFDYPDYMSVLVAISEADSNRKYEKTVWDLSIARAEQEKQVVLEEYEHFQDALAQAAILKQVENPMDITYLVDWMQQQDVFESKDKFLIAATLYVNTDQFPQFEQAALAFFKTFKTFSGNWELYLGFFSLRVTGVQKVLDLTDRVLDGIEPHTQMFNTPFRNELLQFLNIFSRTGDFSKIQTILAEKANGYSIGEYIEDWFDSLQKDENYPTIITPGTFRRNMLPTMPAQVRMALQPYLEELNTFLEASPLYMSRLAHLARANNSILSQNFIQILSGHGKKLEVSKTGSGLHAFLSDKLGIVVNEVPINSLDTWQLAHDLQIPVSPILKTGRQVPVTVAEGQETVGKRVFTRFSGSNVYEWLCAEGTPELAFFVDGEIKKIAAMMAEHHIEHGHPHLANYTVEFVEKSWYEEQRAAGMTVNTLPFDEQHFSFDVRKYRYEPNKWQPIIRLIDWDRSVSPTTLPETSVSG